MNTTNFDKIRDYYAQDKEWDRLETATGKLEYIRTLNLIEQYVPQSSQILDLGGGPGRYTIALAQKNHRMSLADLSPDLLKTARQNIDKQGLSAQIESIHEINAIDLSSYPDNSFDTVLALGPFYHLHRQSERQKCASEIHRVLRKDGHAFIVFLPKLNMLSDLIARAASKPEQVSSQTFKETHQTGIFRNNTTTGGFQEAYCTTSKEIDTFFNTIGFQTLTIQSLKGIAFGHTENLFKIEQSDPKLFKTIWEVLEETATNESVIELGQHALYIGQKS